MAHAPKGVLSPHPPLADPGWEAQPPRGQVKPEVRQLAEERNGRGLGVGQGA